MSDEIPQEVAVLFTEIGEDLRANGPTDETVAFMVEAGLWAYCDGHDALEFVHFVTEYDTPVALAMGCSGCTWRRHGRWAWTAEHAVGFPQAISSLETDASLHRKWLEHLPAHGESIQFEFGPRLVPLPGQVAAERTPDELHWTEGRGEHEMERARLEVQEAVRAQQQRLTGAAEPPLIGKDLLDAEMTRAWAFLREAGVPSPERAGPIATARELLLQGFAASSDQVCREMVTLAGQIAASAVNEPEPAEYFGDRTMAVAEAALWDGIIGGLLGENPAFAGIPFDMATRAYEAAGDGLKIGRTQEEFAEFYRMAGDERSARERFEFAADVFDRIGRSDRALSARLRAKGGKPSKRSGFLARVHVPDEATSVLGSTDGWLLRERLLGAADASP